ncbi:MAG: dioxygenase [Gallionellaceae bacterium]|jgi:aromatic ring-opening dioxygenase catalytic subunit (LigB family)|nr:dioxygenase [Gallionellaceae bacterium]
MNAANENLSRPLPTLYVPHGGGPCFFMDWTIGPSDTWDKMAAWLRQLGNEIESRYGKPRAILAISAHWEERQVTVQKRAHPGLLYDYYGFPAHTYQLQYNAPGDPALAPHVTELLEAASIPVHSDATRGLDHGVFVPFKLIFPDADIPVCQMSLQAGLNAASHLAIGQALAPLRQQGVLIIGSGMSYHNMRAIFTGSGTADSLAFDAWLTETVELADANARNHRLENWAQAPSARASHPREEHLLPLMIAAGAASEPGRRIFSDCIMETQLSAYSFGDDSGL